MCWPQLQELLLCVLLDSRPAIKEAWVFIAVRFNCGHNDAGLKHTHKHTLSVVYSEKHLCNSYICGLAEISWHRLGLVEWLCSPVLGLLTTLDYCSSSTCFIFLLGLVTYPKCVLIVMMETQDQLHKHIPLAKESHMTAPQINRMERWTPPMEVRRGEGLFLSRGTWLTHFKTSDCGKGHGFYTLVLV